MSTFIIRCATFQSSSYPVVFMRLSGPCSRPNCAGSRIIANSQTCRPLSCLGYYCCYYCYCFYYYIEISLILGWACYFRLPTMASQSSKRSSSKRSSSKEGKRKNSVDFEIQNETTNVETNLSNSEANLVSTTGRPSLPFVVAWWKNYRKDDTDKVGCDEEGVYQCIKHNHAPPPDEIEISTSVESCTSPGYHLKISRNTLKQRIFELMKSINATNVHYLEDIEKGRITAEEAENIFSTFSNMERNIAFLSAAFYGRLDLLKVLVENKADMQVSEPTEGFTALHLSAFNDNVECASYLISCGADVNYAPEKYTPLETACFHNSYKVAKLLLDSGAKPNVARSTENKEFSYNSTPLHSAVKANAVECVQLLLSERKASSRNIGEECYSPLHVAAEMGHLQCLKLILESEVDPNIVTPDTKNTALHLAAEGGFNECLLYLLSKGAKPDIRNIKGQIPLHLAARVQSLDCVEILLNVGHCNANSLDCDRRSPLHAGVTKALNSSEITELLISKGANVNHEDIYGYTPLHVAAINENTACVQILINNGANVAKKTKGGNSALGIIMRKVPLALPALYKKLNSSLIVHDPEISSGKEVTMKLDFRIFLQHCQKGEIDFLNTFLDEGQKDILEHPLCQAFLHIKWQKIRKYFIARILFYFIFVLFLTLYVFVAFVICSCEYSDKQNTTSEIVAGLANGILQTLKPNDSVMKISHVVSDKYVENVSSNSSNSVFCGENHVQVRDGLWSVVIFFTVIEALRKAYALTGCTKLKKYFFHLDNIVEWFVLISNFIISCVYIEPQDWQKQLAAFTILFAWVNLLFLIGQTPVLGSYVAMYIKVQKQFGIIFIAYACLLIGFTLSFSVIFYTRENFQNVGIGFVQIITYMIGALDYKSLVFDSQLPQLGLGSHLIFFIFILFVTIIMWNLLVGIAVRDIQGLEQTAGISRLVRQTKLISSIEVSLFNNWLPKYVLAILRHTALISPSGYRVVLQVKPLNHQEKRLPKDILQRAYEIAKAGRHNNRNPSVTSRILSFIGSKQNSSSQLLPESVNIEKLQQGIATNFIAISRLTEEIKELKAILREIKKN